MLQAAELLLLCSLCCSLAAHACAAWANSERHRAAAQFRQFGLLHTPFPPPPPSYLLLTPTTPWPPAPPPQVGELVGGSQREDRLDVLTRRITGARSARCSLRMALARHWRHRLQTPLMQTPLRPMCTNVQLLIPFPPAPAESGMPLEAYAGYLDLRKYGTVPHSGASLSSQQQLLLAGCMHGNCWAGLGLRKYGTVPHSGVLLSSGACGSCLSKQSRHCGCTCRRAGLCALGLQAWSASYHPKRGDATPASLQHTAWPPAHPTAIAAPGTKPARPVRGCLPLFCAVPQALAWALSASSCLPRAWTTFEM